jgi:KDO2-lipid IV(A) lauroyltransferase
MQTIDRKPLYRFWAPRYWHIWLGMALLRLSSVLPYRMQIAMGRFMGRVLHRFAGKRRAIVRRNIELCFPDFSIAKRDAIALAHFESMGTSIFEMGLGRWASDEKLLAMTEIHGARHVQEAADRGVGVILLSAHFTCLEISGRVLSLNIPPFYAVHRSNKNPLVTALYYSGRERSAKGLIEKNDMKGMVRALRATIPVWYAPDQSYSGKQSALLPFFGVPAMVNTATSTLAKLGKAVVIPFFPRRLPQGGYRLDILPPLSDIPSRDAAADTLQYHKVLEDYIRLCPEQYYWVHRKFKNRPPPLPDVYFDLDAWK